MLNNLRLEYKLKQAFEIKQSFPSIQLISAQIQVQVNEWKRLVIDSFICFGIAHPTLPPVGFIS